ncbi:OmpH/Skp family outer membrane protein [Natronospora cellulosivora (SeqCode)]
MKKILLFTLLMSLFFLVACDNAEPEQTAVMDLQLVLENSSRAQKMHQELLEIGNKLEVKYDEREEGMSSGESQEELEKIYQEYMEHKYFLEYNLNQEITRVIEEIASEEGIDVVLLNQGVYYGGIDITSQVINKLDELDGE